MKKTILKTIALLLLLLVISASAFFVIYPNYSAVKIQLDKFDSAQITNNTTLNVFSKISYPTIAQASGEQGEEGTLEYLSQEQLEKHREKNEIVKLEEKNTILKVSSADVDGRVVDGEDANALERGFWYYPLSSPPGEKGNTIIIGHRFLHLPPRRDTFFNLEEVKIGDKIVLKQKDDEYKYTVINIRVVDKNDTSILANTTDYRVTLITCTPLWTSEKRLVITGKMNKVYGII
jgi:LPXTG-site transpeptidase (sortase) family protein